MDAKSFDRWTTAFAERPTRRAALRLLAGGLLAPLLSPRRARAARQGDGADELCPQGMQRCDGECVDLLTDPVHCGQCGLPCASELGAGACIGGVCACSPGTTRCDDVCVNTERDPLNCGGCGNECLDDGECFDGVCAPGGSTGGSLTGGGSTSGGSAQVCPEGQTRCDGVCVDLNIDLDHCGECTSSCSNDLANSVCRSGRCVLANCADFQDFCPNAGCVDLATDPDHCGECGIACPSGSCRYGACDISEDGACPTGQTACEEACVDLQTDVFHCGTCGTVCALDKTCEGGACVDVQCPTGTTLCPGGVCVDLMKSPINCGTCATSCAANQFCQSGTCVAAPTCGPYTTFCQAIGECRDLYQDDTNCGDCGVSCVSGYQCRNSQCIFGGDPTLCVDPALYFCPGAGCVNIEFDAANCGLCGITCAADQVCQNFACRSAANAITCPAGQRPCNDVCVDLRTDPTNCGMCGTSCGGPPCIDGFCGGPPPEELLCYPGFTNCNGVCVDIFNDPAHCGDCGAACPAGETCVGGECAPGATAGCPEGQVLCGDACRNAVPVFGTNGLVCAGGGAPPTACPAGQVLCNGACYPEGACPPAADCPPGQGLCYGICRDFLNDPGYCGGCSTACPGGICSAGACVSCAEGLTPCGAACVDTRTDLANCGFCGNLCGTQCLDGQCLGVGPAPLEVTPACALAGESCVSNGNCCSGARCIYGHCYVLAEVCAYGSAKCPSTAGTFCADTENDPNFCGDCTTRCAAGDVCQDGDCYTPNSATSNDLPSQPIVAAEEPIMAAEEPVAAPEEPPAPSCPEGQVDCGGGCTDLSFDPLNCGGCGVSCGPGIACDFGVCGVEPAPPAPPETAVEEPIVVPEEPVAAVEEPVVAAEEPAECLAAGGACDPAAPGACCSGVCNGDGACA
jgi:hypothetical protein